jgi:transcription termination factor Rho
MKSRTVVLLSRRNQPLPRPSEVLNRQSEDDATMLVSHFKQQRARPFYIGEKVMGTYKRLVQHGRDVRELNTILISDEARISPNMKVVQGHR